MNENELDDLNNLVTSAGWKHLKALLDNHKAFLQRELNLEVSQGNPDKASRAQAKFEDVYFIVDDINRRRTELKGGV